jgi:MFS family permease
VSSTRTLLIALGSLAWLTAIIGGPMAAGWLAAALDLGAGGIMAAWTITFLVLFVATIVGVLSAVSWGEKRARDFVRNNGVRCTAYVKRFDRFGRSMTQQKVLFLIELPGGPVGRDYVMSGLDSRWLADVCALNKPISVIAHPDATTLIIE